MRIKNLNKTARNESSFKTRPVLDVNRTISNRIFEDRTRPWCALFDVHPFIYKFGEALPYDEYDEISENVWVHISAYLSTSAKIEPPAIICGGARLCNHTFIKGSIVGAFATVGEFSSVKDSIMFDRSKLCGHNSLLTSILGYESIMHERAISADTNPDGKAVNIKMPEGIYDTGKARLGAVICDGARIGVSCTIAPGTIIDGMAVIPPASYVSGYIYPYSSLK